MAHGMFEFRGDARKEPNRRAPPLLVGLLLIATVTACFFPEQFDVLVTVNKDRSYRIEFNGILTFVLARAHERERGSLSQKDEAELKRMESDLLKDQRFKKVHYQGHGRFAVHYLDEGKLTGRVVLSFSEDFNGREIPILTVIPISDGQVDVVGTALSARDVQQLKALDMKVDGHIRVKTNGVVLKHNASQTPALFGMVGSYQWTIKSESDPLPAMRIKL